MGKKRIGCTDEKHLEELYEDAARAKFNIILNNRNHPLHKCFKLLPHGVKIIVPSSRTHHLQEIFIAIAIAFNNSNKSVQQQFLTPNQYCSFPKNFKRKVKCLRYVLTWAATAYLQKAAKLEIKLGHAFAKQFVKYKLLAANMIKVALWLVMHMQTVK